MLKIFHSLNSPVPVTTAQGPLKAVTTSEKSLCWMKVHLDLVEVWTQCKWEQWCAALLLRFAADEEEDWAHLLTAAQPALLTGMLPWQLHILLCQFSCQDPFLWAPNISPFSAALPQKAANMHWKFHRDTEGSYLITLLLATESHMLTFLLYSLKNRQDAKG